MTKAVSWNSEQVEVAMKLSLSLAEIIGRMQINDPMPCLLAFGILINRTCDNIGLEPDDVLVAAEMLMHPTEGVLPN